MTCGLQVRWSRVRVQIPSTISLILIYELNLRWNAYMIKVLRLTRHRMGHFWDVTTECIFYRLYMTGFCWYSVQRWRRLRDIAITFIELKWQQVLRSSVRLASKTCMTVTYDGLFVQRVLCYACLRWKRWTQTTRRDFCPAATEPREWRMDMRLITWSVIGQQPLCRPDRFQIHRVTRTDVHQARSRYGRQFACRAS